MDKLDMLPTAAATTATGSRYEQACGHRASVLCAGLVFNERMGILEESRGGNTVAVAGR